LYNSRARLQFKALSQGPTSVSGGALIGLGRSIQVVLEPAQIDHAVATIEQRLRKGSAEAVANFITTSRTGQLLRTQMAPVLGDNNEIGGYVLTLENITRSFERDSQRDQVLNTLTEGSRSSLGNMRAAAETLLDDADMPAPMRERLLRVVAEEATTLSRRLDQTMSEFADSLKTRWPLEDVLGMDLISAASQRIETRHSLLTKTEEIDERLWVRADSFSLIQAITFLAGRLHDHYEIREIRFRLLAEGKMANFDLIWSGPPVSSETFFGWEMDPMSGDGETTPLTLRDVVNRHGGEVWYQREATAHRAFIRLVIPVATPPEAEFPTEAVNHSRNVEFYDFNLFNYSAPGIDLDRKLSELSFTVFDTETTGLNPAGGDEIIQIGALRIVNGRLLQQESFVQLVDPQMPIKPEGIPIHGITDDMVRGKPRIGAVLPAFSEFCAETVLVAHNGAFDMRFLQLKEAATGIRFTQPVLDTLLLSAVIHPGQDSHSLEEIAARLGVTVQGRHTALGDAQVTGEIFLRMLPLLADQGITTLRQAIEAAEKTYYASIKY
ncbi:MAG TPA: exonuclease domain-containing protein, partial [Rhodocyclaceae bacterium]|nr:exonuclease domain-containing protein [Rhodocyclaceae bacterium]